MIIRPRVITATVSGSFNRNMPLVIQSVERLKKLGVQILSPSQPHIVGWNQDFAVLQSDTSYNIRENQDKHLAAIAVSDFLWVATDGYIGNSTAMEIGYAHASFVPAYSDTLPAYLTCDDVAGLYIERVADYKAAVEKVRQRLFQPT